MRSSPRRVSKRGAADPSAAAPRPSRRALAACLALAASASLACPASAQDAALLPPADAQESARLVWAVFPVVPYMIADGPDRGTGIFDRVRRLLDERLDGTRHRTIVAPFPRIFSALKDGADWCFVGGVETPEREGVAAFSLPVAMFYPLRIVVPTAQRARFEALRPLSLEGLLRDGSLRTSFLRDRSLGPAIDGLLRRNPPAESHSDFRQAVRMLLAGRIDYLVDYPGIAGYGAKEQGQEGALVGLPFAEAPEPVFSRVMCAGTDWGRRMIARIDAVLRAERPTPAYRGIVEAWSAGEDLATIRAAYDTAFLHGE